MLQRIKLENYRCYKHHEVDFRELTIIVGKNNAGKSTLIEALRLISLVTSRYKKLAFSTAPAFSNIPKQYYGVKPSLKGLEFSFESIFHLYGPPPAKITAEFSNNSSIELFIDDTKTIHAVIWGSNGRPVQSRSAARNLDLPQINILPQIAPLLKYEKPLYGDYVKSNVFSSLASQHFRNQIQYLNEHYEEFEKLSELTWNNLRIREFINGSKIEEQNPTLLVQDGDFVAEIGWMGHGLQMWLQTMWFLARTRMSATIILDEPDVYMHADLQRKLIRFLKSSNQQIILATHSIEIMSEVEPENIVVIDRQREKSIYCSNFPAVQKIVQHIGSIQNIEMARLWAAKKILIVEGGDVSILKRIQNILFKDSNEPFDMIPNMSIGGWGGWSYAIGSKMLLKNAGDSSIDTYCLMDSDYHSEKAIGKRYADAEEKHVRLHIWKKKEIENYLLVPEAILRIINRCKKKAKKIELEVIIQKLDEIAENLKDVTTDSIATKNQNENRGMAAGTAHKLARKMVQDNWGERLSLVSGKAMIKQLNMWSNKEYGASFNAIEIAKELYKDDIDDEVNSVVTSIEKCIPF